ncbi:MAG: sel1 repeat family protein [Acidobacteriia bacterium]|nr:sel1 repeat family protein [Terriglobia bacterium]
MRHEQSQKSKASDLFLRASKQWDRGELRSAFRLFMAAAKAGDRGAQVNVGYFYDRGVGVRKNRSEALYWYKRAYRRGDAGAANNIGTIWRDEKNARRALFWFQQAVSLGDDGSNLEIARHYLRIEHNPSKARDYLEKVCASNRVSEMEAEEAKRLLRRL